MADSQGKIGIVVRQRDQQVQVILQQDNSIELKRVKIAATVDGVAKHGAGRARCENRRSPFGYEGEEKCPPRLSRPPIVRHEVFVQPSRSSGNQDGGRVRPCPPPTGIWRNLSIADRRRYALVMASRRKTNRDTSAPEGIDFLDSVLRFTSKCERLTDAYLAFNSSHSSLSTHVHLGTVLSLLDRASSCWWRCRGGNHSAEMLIGRCCSYGFCAYKLGRSGFYDESVSLARSVGEITNLAVLFIADSTTFQEWQTLDERARRDNYSPVKVRLSLEAKNLPVVINKSRYGQLSAKATHLTPSIPPQMYNAERHPKTGGYFQEAGVCFCLAEIGFAFSVLAPCAARLCELSEDNGATV